MKNGHNQSAAGNNCAQISTGHLIDAFNDKNDLKRLGFAYKKTKIRSHAKHLMDTDNWSIPFERNKSKASKTKIVYAHVDINCRECNRPDSLGRLRACTVDGQYLMHLFCFRKHLPNCEGCRQVRDS